MSDYSETNVPMWVAIYLRLVHRWWQFTSGLLLLWSRLGRWIVISNHCWKRRSVTLCRMFCFCWLTWTSPHSFTNPLHLVKRRHINMKQNNTIFCLLVCHFVNVFPPFFLLNFPHLFRIANSYEVWKSLHKKMIHNITSCASVSSPPLVTMKPLAKLLSCQSLMLE